MAYLAVVGPYEPHTGRAHRMRMAEAERIVRGMADRPYRALCGLVVTSVWQGRTGTKFGWGVNLWGKAADYHRRCKKCWREG